MSTDGYEIRLRELLEATLEQPSEHRLDFLAASGADKQLRLEVMEMLGDLTDLSNYLELPAIAMIDSEDSNPTPIFDGRADLAGHDSVLGMLGPPRVAPATPTTTKTKNHEVSPEAETLPATPKTLGPYRLIQVLGQGGMGQVYLAEHPEPLRRQVALKTVRGPGSVEELLHRFELEQLVMARMDHPNIAQAYGAGASRDGAAYLASELLAAGTITEYCDHERLDLATRIELFEQVCKGVRHAHRQGVIHRDIKPSNVLVKVVDDRPIPKLIDFGIAKWLDPAKGSGITATGAVVGSPAAMPPEILNDPEARDADVRIDIFALGVLLHRLLVSEKPFDGSSGLIARLQDAESPSSPSQTFLGLEPETQTRRALDRRTSPRKLVRGLRGDLDAIALKAMANRRSERYPSVDALLADLERYRLHQPVEAHPGGVGYRVRKTLARRRQDLERAAFLACCSGSRRPI